MTTEYQTNLSGSVRYLIGHVTWQIFKYCALSGNQITFEYWTIKQSDRLPKHGNSDGSAFAS